MATEIYNKRLLIVIRGNGREETRSRITVTVETSKSCGNGRGRLLILRLTDENNLFFLHTLHMTAEDFQELKNREKILIDFDAFPRHIIEFFDLCTQEEQKRPPKYLAHLILSPYSDDDVPHSRLEIIETSDFQHVTRLNLSLTPANDVELKKYLADCLNTARAEKNHAEQQAENADRECRHRLQNVEVSLRKKTEELEQLQSTLNERLSSLHDRYSDELASEREKSTVALRELQQKVEEEKRNLELGARRSQNKLEAKNYELEAINKDLAEKRHRIDGGVQELKDRIAGLEEELQRKNGEIQNHKRQLGEAQNQIRDLENYKHNADEGAKKHQEVITRLQDRISAGQDQIEKLEKILEQKDIKVSRSQKDYQLQTMELNKANDIIRKLQLDNRTCSEKLKVRSGIVVQQEVLLKEVRQELESAKAEIVSLKIKVEQQEKESADLNSALLTEKSNYAEAERNLENNANVISWLNRQLNVLNGRTVQSVHPSSAISSVAPGLSDLNMPPLQRDRPQRSSASPRSNDLSSRSASSRTGSKIDEIPSDSPRAPTVSFDGDGQSERGADTKYFRKPLVRRHSSSKLSPFTPVSALKSVSSAYFA